MKYFSMFTGVGGFELGLENHECVGVSEIDKYANMVLKHRFPEVKNYGDATKINTDELPEFDMLVGGFPCQAFSIAGKRRGFKDTRGTLFFEIERIIKAKKPKVILLENVKGLLNHNKGETFRVIIQTLSELGYDVQWMVLNSKFFGVPQNRERVFIIGNIRGTSRPEILPFRENAKEIPGIHYRQFNRKGNNSQQDRLYYTEGISPTLQKEGSNDIKIASCITANYWKGPTNNPKERTMVIGSTQKNAGVMKDCSTCLGEAMGKGGGHIPMVLATRKKDRDKPREQRDNSGYGQQFEPRKDDVTNTISSFDKDNYIATNKLRRLTPRECERLQGFPDDWTLVPNDKGKPMSDTQRYKMMGNAVTVNVIKAISSKLKEATKK